MITAWHDLAEDSPPGLRLQRLVERVQQHFACGAVALLQLDGEFLRPLATVGMVSDVLGRRFAVAQHPRLAAILARSEVTRFHNDSALPDPYDGLLLGHEGEPLPVHDCMGMSLRVNGRVWGVLTLDSLRVGAFEPAVFEQLPEWAAYAEAAVRVHRLEEEINGLRLIPSSDTADAKESQIAGDIVGQSRAVQDLLHEIKVVAHSELPVLLTGETGVGKDLLAHRLHQLSRRRHKPLVHVNCAALPESLAESELFGHVKGAFSGAVTDRPGRFEAADKGTLFLDEVGELSLTVQAKLLRALQNGEIQRLGSDKPRYLDVRVIAATNRNLQELVRQGAFRADLYHRISVYPVPVPPLRERGADILLLAGRFLELNRARVGLRAIRLSDGAQHALLSYAWPGNVRELEHVISRATLKAVSRGAGRQEIVTLEAGMLDVDVPHRAPVGVQAPVAGDTGPEHAVTVLLRQAVEATQQQAIQSALAATGNNWAQAAKRLGLDASNLHKLARRLGIKT